MVTTDIAERLLTAEDFAALEDRETLYELVRGKLVGFHNVKLAQAFTTTNILGTLFEHDFSGLGWLTCGGVGVITGRNPDTVREAKIAYFSSVRNPRAFEGKLGWEAIPDLVIENPRPEEHWGIVLGRTVDLLQAGVNVVAVVDFPDRIVRVFCRNRPPQTLTVEDKLNLGKLLPESMPGCVLSIREFFEA